MDWRLFVDFLWRWWPVWLAVVGLSAYFVSAGLEDYLGFPAALVPVFACIDYYQVGAARAIRALPISRHRKAMTFLVEGMAVNIVLIGLGVAIGRWMGDPSAHVAQGLFFRSLWLSWLLSTVILACGFSLEAIESYGWLVCTIALLFFPFLFEFGETSAWTVVFGVALAGILTPCMYYFLASPHRTIPDLSFGQSGGETRTGAAPQTRGSSRWYPKRLPVKIAPSRHQAFRAHPCSDGLIVGFFWALFVLVFAPFEEDLLPSTLTFLVCIFSLIAVANWTPALRTLRSLPIAGWKLAVAGIAIPLTAFAAPALLLLFHYQLRHAGEGALLLQISFLLPLALAAVAVGAVVILEAVILGQITSRLGAAGLMGLIAFVQAYALQFGARYFYPERAVSPLWGLAIGGGLVCGCVLWVGWRLRRGGKIYRTRADLW